MGRLRILAAIAAFVLGVALVFRESVFAPTAPETARDIAVIWQRVFWIDDRTVVFAAESRQDAIDPDIEDPVHIYVWRPDEGPPGIHRSAWSRGDQVLQRYFCASGGRLIYAVGAGRVDDEDARYIRYETKEGPLGAERPGVIRSAYLQSGETGLQPRPQGLLPANHLWIRSRSNVGKSCAEEVDAEMVGAWWNPTSSPGRYLQFVRTDLQAVLAVSVVDRAPGVSRTLQIPEGRVRPDCVARTPWDRATWLWSCGVSGSPADVPGAFHSLWRVVPETSEVFETRLPVHPATRFLEPVFTARGVYYITSETDDGLFVMTPDGQVDSLLRGRFGRAEVSPDGCRIALSRLRGGVHDLYSLVVFNVCTDQ